jgi:hypothetical protein
VSTDAYVFEFPGCAPKELAQCADDPLRPWGFVGDNSSRLVEVALREFRSAEPTFPLTTFRGGRGVGKSLLAHGAARLLATHHPRGTVSIYTGSLPSKQIRLVNFDVACEAADRSCSMESIGLLED